MTGERVARRIVVRGRVQGVFFRDTTRREADRLGVCGWVANRPDGSVVVHAEGTERAVSALVSACRTGPPSARVEAVEIEDAEPEDASSFTVR